MLKAECEHYTQQVKDGVVPQSTVCEDCGLEGPLRMCATCGFVGCCESRNSHDTEHWQKTNHSVIRQMPLVDTSFVYCYTHLEYLN